MHPEQARALAYLQRKGTDAPFEETVERLRRAAGEIEELLSTVGETAARRRPDEGRWSVQEVADHLAISHRPALEQWRTALDGLDPGPAVEAHLTSPGVLERSFRSVRRDLEAVHRGWIELAVAVDARALDAAPAIPVRLVIRAEHARLFEWDEAMDAKAFVLAVAVHTREHERQIRRTLEALSRDQTLDTGPVLETERLRLRPVERADVSPLRRHFNRPRVRRYLFDDEEVTLETTRGIVESSVARFRSRGYGLWLATERGQETSSIAGFGGYGFFFEPPELQILFGLAPELWGRGLGTELGHRLVDYGFEDLGFERIVGATDPPNTASARLMERLGMVRQPDAVRHGQRLLYFSIQAPSGPAGGLSSPPAAGASPR